MEMDKTKFVVVLINLI